MKWAKESLNGGLRVDYLVLVKDEEKYYFLATNDAEIAYADFAEAVIMVQKQFGYRLGWSSASPSQLHGSGYKCLE